MQKKHIFKVFKVLVKIIIGIIILFTILFFYFYGAPFDWNKHDSNLEKFAQEFDDLPLPSKSQQIGTLYKKFGLMGNGNHCDYYVSKLIESDLTKEELQLYFSNLYVSPVDIRDIMAYGYSTRGNKVNDVYVTQKWKDLVIFVIPETKEKEKQLTTEVQNVRKNEVADQHNISSKLITDKVFLISSVDMDYFPNDIRCN